MKIIENFKRKVKDGIVVLSSEGQGVKVQEAKHKIKNSETGQTEKYTETYTYPMEWVFEDLRRLKQVKKQLSEQLEQVNREILFSEQEFIPEAEKAHAPKDEDNFPLPVPKKTT